MFDKIVGSYANVVGLPLVKLVELLRHPWFEGRVQFRFDEEDRQRDKPVTMGAPKLSILSIGDINYDLMFDQFPAGFFSRLRPPGEHVEGALYRYPGGTGAMFALRAREQGFEPCSILGVVGRDALGRSIEDELNEIPGIRTLFRPIYDLKTSIALILRDTAEKDTLVTLTDAHQVLTEEDIEARTVAAIDQSVHVAPVDVPLG